MSNDKPEQSASEELERHVEGNRRVATFYTVSIEFARKQAEEIDRLRAFAPSHVGEQNAAPQAVESQTACTVSASAANPAAAASDGEQWDKAIETAARVVDQCNREGPYAAIGAASRIRALKGTVAPSASGKYGFTEDQALCILKVRDALLAKDVEEAYHWLYTLDSKQMPHDPFNPWRELEALSRAPESNAKVKP